MNEEQLKLYEALTPLQKACVDIKIKYPSLSNGEIYTRAVIPKNITYHYARQYGFNILNNPNVKLFLTSMNVETIDDMITSREQIMADLSNIADTQIEDVIDIIHTDDTMMNVDTGDLYTGMESMTVRRLDQIPEHARKSIKSIKQGRYGIEITLYDGVQARKMLSDMQGYNAPIKTELTGANGGPIAIHDMDDSEFDDALTKLGLGDD